MGLTSTVKMTKIFYNLRVIPLVYVMVFLNEKVLCIARKRGDIYVVFLFYPFLPIFPLACSRRWDSWVRRERRTVTSCPFGFFSAHISLRSSRSERLQLYDCSLRNMQALGSSGRKKNWRARGRHGCLPLMRSFFLAPTTWNMKAPETGLTALSLC